MRLVHRVDTNMKIQAGGEHVGCSKAGDSQVVCVQCQDEAMRVCPGSPRSPRRAIATRLSSGSADREPSSSSFNVSSGTFYSCVSQITIGQVAIGFSRWNSPVPESHRTLPSPEPVSCPASLSVTPLPTGSASQETLCDGSRTK